MAKKEIDFATRRQIYKKAIDHFGKTNQVMVLLEEMNELGQAIIKYMFRGGPMNHVAEEAADVTIMLEQLVEMYPELDNAISIWMDRKVKRLAEKLHTEV